MAPFPISEVIRHINAFALRVQEVNADAKVKVVWTNTWFDPATEREADDSLVGEGVDVIASGQDSTASGEAAMAAGLPFVGYDSDQSENLSDIWLTASLYHRGPYYMQRIQALAGGSWETGEYYGDIADGFGWIAIALVIFAFWRPDLTLLGAFLFGAFSRLGFTLQARNVDVPSELLSSLPYLMTIIVLVVVSSGWSRRRLGAPAALGVAYEREAR